MSIRDFQRFLVHEQKDSQASINMDYVHNLMTQFFPDIHTFNNSEPSFTVPQFLSFLFSSQNICFNEKHSELYQDMAKPLSWYWIATSHNTYLTGNQLTSESTVEAYIRCLRWGCRCIELDCWDGPNTEPIIKHGYTPTTKIKFLDVVKVIKKYAFAATDFPLILSIENHCNNKQQIKMAEYFIEHLGDYLLTEFIDPNETQLPSPEQLKKKIILKDKRSEKNSEKKALAREDSLINDNLLSDAIKTGLVYMEDKEKRWDRYLFVLTPTNISYERVVDDDDAAAADDDDDNYNDADNVDEHKTGNEDELHFSEKWFHKKMPRQEAERLLKEYHKGDGSFLVRPSNNFVGDFSLSFWLRDKVKHCHIKSRRAIDGSTKFYVFGQKDFDNLYSLTNYYQLNPMKSEQFKIILREPVPQPNDHLDKDWYHDNLTRQIAENILKRLQKDGYFLVRKRMQDKGVEAESYAISFRTGGAIKHCVIKKDGRLFMIGSIPFESLTDLISHYEKNPLYRKTKLQYPCNQSVVKEFGKDSDGNDEGLDQIYTDIPNMTIPRAACLAKYDCRGQNDNELTFIKGALIVNVIKYDGGWWRGDYNGQVQKLFPANFTEETVLKPKQEILENPVVDVNLESHQMGVIDLTGCHAQLMPPRSSMIFRLISKSGEFTCSVDKETELNEWVKAIQDASTNKNNDVNKDLAPREQKKIAKELSDLIIYCASVPFTEKTYEEGEYFEMSSFSERKAEKYVSRKGYDTRFIKYHQRQLSRVYPKGTRVNSSNFDPVHFWNFGVQMCALNYQTGDRSMQIERGKFMDNGGCGFVLQPDLLRDPSFDPFDKNACGNIMALNFRITVVAARHLPKIRGRMTSPFVEVSIVGLTYDSYSFRTKTKCKLM